MTTEASEGEILMMLFDFFYSKLLVRQTAIIIILYI
jgi:hypothetical protein